MRLFIAISLSKDVKEKLADLQKKPIGGVRWLSKEQYHLTLKFLGRTERKLSKNLQQRLSTINRPAFSLHIKGLGTFPQDGRPRVLWANVVENDQLNDLQQKVAELSLSLGFDPANHSFNPHITLARMNQGEVSKSEIKSFIEQHREFEINEIPIDEFVLYQSTRHADGAKYERLRSFSL